MKREHEFEMALYKGGPSQRDNVNELDYGSLLTSLTEDHWSFSISKEDGSTTFEDGPVYVQVNRTHEWELILGLVIVGGGIFAKKIVEKIAERTFNWAEEQVKRLGTKGQANLISPEGASIAVDSLNKASSIDAIAKLLEVAAQRKLRIQLVIEPTK